MSETVELQTLADCADDQSLYEAVNPEESTEDEYLGIRNISESVLKQNDVVYENTILNTSTVVKDICTPRDYNHENFHSVNKEIANIRKSFEEQTTYLRRLQIVCIALGAALVISSVTIGVLMHLMRERIGHAEQKSEIFGKLVAKTGTGTSTNATLEKRITKIEETLTIVTNNQAVRLSQLEYGYDSVQLILGNHTVRLMDIEMDRASDTATIQSHNTRIQELKTAQTDINEVLKQYNETLISSGLQIGFTAQGNTRMDTGVLRFTSVKSNIGSGYASTTGVFTCKHPGLYYFSLSLIKQRASSKPNNVYCYIRKNGTYRIYTYINPGDRYADYGSYGTSVSLVIHLAAGDQIDIGGCSPDGTIFSLSTFSGFLLKAD